MKQFKPNRESGSILVVLFGFALVATVVVVAIGALLYTSMRPGAEFRVAKNAVFQELSSEPTANVTVRAPGLLVSAVRTGLSFVDELDDEARAALKSVHSGEVGIFTLRDSPGIKTKAAIARKVDAALKSYEWSRTVLVIENDALVMVYTPEEIDNPARARAMVIALSEQELVIAAADGDLRPLFKLVHPHLREAMQDLGQSSI